MFTNYGNRWNRYRVLKTFNDKDSCIVWCEENGLLPTSRECLYHKTPMRLNYPPSCAGYGFFRCNKKHKFSGAYTCTTYTVSRLKGTWLENAKCDLPTIFSLMYSFANGESYEQACNEVPRLDGSAPSHNTLATWFSFCREIVVIDYMENVKYGKRIGGSGKIVQVYELKFGKRKFSCSSSVTGHWLLVMIEKGGDDLRIEICPGNTGVLPNLIEHHVAPGSEVHTDMWKAYSGLKGLPYVHKVVKHSDPEDPSTHDRTSTEGTQSYILQWRAVKQLLGGKHISPDEFPDHLVEYQWKKLCRVRSEDPFHKLLCAIKYVYAQ